MAARGVVGGEGHSIEGIATGLPCRSPLRSYRSVMDHSECVPEQAGNTLEGCGVCHACRQHEAENVENAVSGGNITEDEAETMLEQIWR